MSQFFAQSSHTDAQIFAYSRAKTAFEAISPAAVSHALAHSTSIFTAFARDSSPGLLMQASKASRQACEQRAQASIAASYVFETVVATSIKRSGVYFHSYFSSAPSKISPDAQNKKAGFIPRIARYLSRPNP